MTTSDAFDVVVVGSANLDLVARTKRLPHPGETVSAHGYFEACGGKGANQAIAAARAGARTAFVGAVGRDAAGDILRSAFVTDGVDVARLATVDAPTGRALIGVSDDAENLIIVVPGANHALSIADIDASSSIIKHARVLLMQLEVPLVVVQHAASLAGDDTIVVLNPAPAAELPDTLLAQLDVITPNEHEVELLGGAESLLARGVGAVVVTEGPRGARLVTAAGTTRVPPHPVTPVDTTGAGDAFCGALSARLALDGGLGALPTALRAAAIAGALATTVEGAVPSLPRWARIAAVLQGA
ncbi:MAG: ribokinase [Actinobacteria bacterium]|nr:ribokinase [Actinomycetota bacterium]NDG10631.1 ribokinase [Actinomycetota bacterium]